MAVRNVVLLLTGFFLPSTTLGDWPQFRGPDGQGHSSARGMLLHWNETTNVRWKTAIPGLGWSSPVIADGKVWLTTGLEEGGSLRAIGIDAVSGRLMRNVEVFRIKNPPPVNPKNSYASPTPVVEAGRLYVHFGTMGTACLETATGKIVWFNQDLRVDHKEGPGSSPVLCGDLLIVNCDGVDAQYVAALDKRTGKMVWKTARTGARNPNADFRKAFSTPLVIKVDGHEQIVSAGADRTSAYDPRDGREIWWVDYHGFSNVPRPVYGHGLVYLCTGYFRPELWAVKPDGRGDVTKDHILWRETKQVPTNPSPLLVEEILYTVTDIGMITARSALTGRELWSQRLGSPASASPMAADGRIYICDESGKTTVIRAGAKFELLARNKLEGRIQASPAADGNALFLRTDRYLYRIEQNSSEGTGK